LVFTKSKLWLADEWLHIFDQIAIRQQPKHLVSRENFAIKSIAGRKYLENSIHAGEFK